MLPPKSVTYKISFNTYADSPNEPGMFDIPAGTKDSITFSGAQCAEFERGMMLILSRLGRGRKGDNPFSVNSFKADSVTFDVGAFIAGAKSIAKAMGYSQGAGDKARTYRSALSFEPDMPYSLEFTVNTSRKLSNSELEDVAAAATHIIWGQYGGEVSFDELNVKVL